MTEQQFKAWFDGFNAALSGPPDADQWAKVVEVVNTILAPHNVQYINPRNEWNNPDAVKKVLEMAGIARTAEVSQ